MRGRGLILTCEEQRSLSFVIVGTPRSGTTLVQRLACELPGVRVPPETHFWSRFLPAFKERCTFPLDQVDLKVALDIFCRLPTSAGLNVPVDDIIRSLGGSCREPALLYQQLVIALAKPGMSYGEKTPGHLVWWPCLAELIPWLKFIFVVRDPRAVVASYRLPAGMRRRPDSFLAARWRADQGSVLIAVKTLKSRSLLLRYEDVVAAPDAARATIARFLGIAVSVPGKPANGADLYLPWETWKRGACGPIKTDRRDAWRRSLSWREVAVTERICHREMGEFGYQSSWPRMRSLVIGMPGPVRCADMWIFQRRRRKQRRQVTHARAGDPL